VTSTLCKSRAPATTGTASGHHGEATSKGARAPIGSPDGPTMTSVTVRGMSSPRLSQSHEISSRGLYLVQPRSSPLCEGVSRISPSSYKASVESLISIRHSSAPRPTISDVSAPAAGNLALRLAWIGAGVDLPQVDPAPVLDFGDGHQWR